MQINYHNKKGFAIGIILLFIGPGIIPSIAQNIEKPSLTTSSGNWLYVGGSGLGNYSRIQDAINSANNGDTIYVYKGNYLEHIMVDRELAIIGEDTNLTIIDGQYAYNVDIVTISADNVILNGFTLLHSDARSSCIKIDESSNSTISHCNLFYHDLRAIFIVHSPNTLISHCVINHSNTGITIGELDSENTVISHCQITTEKSSIRTSSSGTLISQCILKGALHISWASNNTIRNCQISGGASSFGVQMSYTSYNTLRNNSFENCGIVFHNNEPYELSHDIDSSNTINGKPIFFLIRKENMELDESSNAGYVALIECSNISIKNLILYGMLIGSSTFNSVENCTFINNSNGIQIHLSSNNQIKNCDFIHILYPIELFNAEKNLISNCYMEYGFPYSVGFGIDLHYYSKENIISDCSIINYFIGITTSGYSGNSKILGCSLSENDAGIMIGDSSILLSGCNIYSNNVGLSVGGSNNVIYRNNFYNNSINAGASGSNTWNDDDQGNYWDDWIGVKYPILQFFPYRIPGTFFSNIDWGPSRHPFQN